MLSIIQILNFILGAKETLFSVSLACLSLEIGVFYFIFKSAKTQITIPKKLIWALSIFLLGCIFAHVAWIITLIRQIFELDEIVPLMGFITRLSWSLYLVHYQALSLFISNFIKKEFKIDVIDKFFLCLSALSFFYSFVGAFIGIKMPLLPLENEILDSNQFLLIPIFAWTLWKVRIHFQRKDIPLILRNQLKVLVPYFVIPFILMQILSISFIASFHSLNLYALDSISGAFCMLTIFYCVKRMRFLNLRNHVESKESFNFVVDFQDTLEQLSYVTSITELSQLTQNFFERAFSIPIIRVRLYLRQSTKTNNDAIESRVEKFLSQNDPHADSLINALYESNVFIKDEIEFTNFYDETPQRTDIVAFLREIHADIFLPIYERKSISGYIIVENDARPRRLYTNKERDEMLVFASYISNIINLLKYNSLQALQQREKELQEELYHKHQAIQHYKESIRSFLRSHKERKIGIIFNRARRFIYANEVAQELIGADINVQQGHPLALALKELSRKVQEYKTVQSTFTHDERGNKLVASGIPSLEHNVVILMIYYPEISDIMRSQFDLLKDPSKWDYILYLETTQSGQLINQLIPGSGEKLLNFKIALLEAALTKKAILIDMPEDDILATVELLHHISMRSHLHTVKLNILERNHEVAIKLFGLNPLLGSHEDGLLATLDNGTLFIENIEYVCLETQQALADYIMSGYFHKYKSEQKCMSNVRIICSSSKNLSVLVQEGQFSKVLYDELKKNSFSMPSLALLPDSEVSNLAEGFNRQAIKAETFKPLIQLSDKDKEKLLDHRASSLQELKEKVGQLLISKTNKHKLNETTHFDSAYHDTDPELVQAIRLGKKALKDPHIMSMLWNKFKNQNKIALLLGVNRSSVNRRCQEYNLGTQNSKIH